MMSRDRSTIGRSAKTGIIRPRDHHLRVADIRRLIHTGMHMVNTRRRATVTPTIRVLDPVFPKQERLHLPMPRRDNELQSLAGTVERERSDAVDMPTPTTANAPTAINFG